MSSNKASGVKPKKGIRLFYYLKEGFGSVFNHGFMSFASVMVIIACLLIMGSFALLAINVNSIISSFEADNVLLAFVDDTLSEEEARALEPEILKLPNVASCQFISRREAMDSFTQRYDNDLFQNMDESVLRHRYAVYMEDIQLLGQTQSDLGHIPGIEYINASQEIAKGLVTTRNVITAITMVLAVILVAVSMFIMSNTIKLTTMERREEIGIMKMVGATNSFIRWPFVIEGFVLGIVGAMVAFLLQSGIYTLLLNRLSERYSLPFISLLPLGAIALPMLIAFLVIGFIIGVLGSAVAIKNYLKV